MSEERPPDFVIEYEPVRIRVDEINATIVNQLNPNRPNNPAAQRLEAIFPALPGVLRLTTRIAGKTWDAIRYLCRDRPEDASRQPEFAVCVPPMARTILDSVFNVVYIFDNPSTNVRRYYASGWRSALEEYERLSGRHGADARWAATLKQQQTWVDWMEADAAITLAEKANRKLVTYWPHPGGMLRRSPPSDAARKSYLEFLGDWFYGHLSGQPRQPIGPHARWLPC